MLLLVFQVRFQHTVGGKCKTIKIFCRPVAVSHKSILVNGQVVNIPSFQVEAGDTVTVRERSRSQLRIQGARNLAAQRSSVDWVEVNVDRLEGVLKAYPERDELPSEINENLIVELYSK